MGKFENNCSYCGIEVMVVSGDFNMVMEAHERDGIGTYSDTDPSKFKEAIGSSHLMEIDCIGCPYTWMNNGRGGRLCQSKIDCSFTNDQWKMTWLA